MVRSLLTFLVLAASSVVADAQVHIRGCAYTLDGASVIWYVQGGGNTSITASSWFVTIEDGEEYLDLYTCSIQQWSQGEFAVTCPIPPDATDHKIEVRGVQDHSYDSQEMHL